MTLLRLTRFPKSAFPTDMVSEDPTIDAFLISLDTQLAGSAGVRRTTLEEASDHLLEQKAQLVASGLSQQVASQQAVDMFGEIEAYATEQRKERYQLFVKMFFRFGLIFATLMTAFTLMSDSFWTEGASVISTILKELPMLLSLFVFYTCFYGLCMSYWYSFAFTPAKPVRSKNQEHTDVLEVYSEKGSKSAAVFLIVLMGSIAIVSLLGIFGVGIMASNGIILNGILCVIGGQMVIGSKVAWTRYELSPDILTIRSLTGIKSFKRSTILDLKEQATWRNLLSTSIGQQYLLLWKDQNGKNRRTRLVINGEMHNADRLIVALQSSAEEADGLKSSSAENLESQNINDINQ
jgi:hypothetical protein